MVGIEVSALQEVVVPVNHQSADFVLGAVSFGGVCGNDVDGAEIRGFDVDSDYFYCLSVDDVEFVYGLDLLRLSASMSVCPILLMI